MLKPLVITKFIPIGIHHPYLAPRREDLEEIVKRIDNSIKLIFEELCLKVNDKAIEKAGMELAQISIGGISGIVITVWVLIKE